MKKIFAVTVALFMCLAIAVCSGEQAIITVQPLSGTINYPDGQNTTLTYTYSFPQFEGGSTAEMINGFYKYLLDDAVAFTIPVNADMLSGETAGSMTVSADITCLNDKFLSVCMRTDSAMGAGSSVVYAGHTFPLEGEKAGQCVNLPYLLGQLTAENTDTWLEDRQTEKVNRCVRELVWEVIEDKWASGEISIFEGTEQEILENVFFPDEDFYLDNDGNPVFFIQEGYLAPVSEGVLLFPFTIDELIDEI